VRFRTAAGVRIAATIRPGRGHRVRFRGSLAWLAPVVALASFGLVACLPPPPPDRPWPPNQSFPGPACLDNPGTVNRVACENTAAGNPASDWDVAGSGDASIQGFATAMSVNRAETVHFKVKTDAALYHLEIYRMGFYGGSGARKVAVVRPSAALPQSQPGCGFDPSVNLLDCGNWAESANWSVPTDAVSGVYIAKLVRDSGATGASHVAFVVRDDASHSDILYQTSDTTWQAYNDYGGYSLYENDAVKVSYNRPFVTRAVFGGQSWFFSPEYPMVRWLEANGYDMSYSTGVDSDRSPNAMLQHKVLLSSGHDEYWSAAQRNGAEAARAAGVNLAFFSGNEVYWKTRWEDDHRTLVCYKENFSKSDPSPIWTGTWRDPRFSPPSDGGRPENALTGTLYGVQNSGAMAVPADDGKMRLWRNTSVAQLAPGAVATLPDGTLGYEWDEDVDDGAGGADAFLGITPVGNAFRPAGLIRMSTTAVDTGTSATQASNDPERRLPSRSAAHPDLRALAQAPTVATHHLTMYRAPSGALVFSAGTIQWAWGLDANHDGTPTNADPRMRQATVNLFADLGAQPATLQPGLVAAQASTDTTPPNSVVTAPTAGTTIHVGQGVFIQGSASDSGGRVGGVDVSTDNGQTWNPASGRDNWIFGWTPSQPGAYTIRSRAADDSANLEHPGPGITVTVIA
jgi:Bacterial Ig domain